MIPTYFNIFTWTNIISKPSDQNSENNASYGKDDTSAMALLKVLCPRIFATAALCSINKDSSSFQFEQFLCYHLCIVICLTYINPFTARVTHLPTASRTSQTPNRSSTTSSTTPQTTHLTHQPCAYPTTSASHAATHNPTAPATTQRPALATCLHHASNAIS